MAINELKNKRVLILGFGREGQDTLKFLRKIFPGKVIGVADRKENGMLKAQSEKSQFKAQNIKWRIGKSYLNGLKNYDVIIKSPGVPVHLPEVEKAFKQGKITSQTEIFFDNCPGKIIGITGTKGKSTTTALIYEILKAGGIKARLVGNIGKPVLNLLSSATPKDVYVYELSSHQLFNLKKSPHIAVFLNIYSEHLDYYRNFNEYARAKANITLHQTKDDYLIYNVNDKLIKEFARKSIAQKIPITGKYYELDRNAAKAVGKLFKIPQKTISKAIKDFKGLPHRLELAGKFRGITFYNDSLATIPEATIAAIDKLGNKVQTLFLGGYDRGINFGELAKKVLKSKVKNIILFPTTGEKIWKALRLASLAHRGQTSVKLPEPFFVDNMKDAVKLAYEHTDKGKIALLSCASPSFGLFKDYAERGDLFKKYAKELSRQ